MSKTYRELYLKFHAGIKSTDPAYLMIVAGMVEIARLNKKIERLKDQLATKDLIESELKGASEERDRLKEEYSIAMEERNNYQNALFDCRKELEEADRRAGEAERKYAYAVDSDVKRAAWLHKAKEQWGVHQNVSFDVVWAEALSLRKELEEARGALQVAADYMKRQDSHIDELSDNAPWLSQAHSLCSDCGIEPGPIAERLEGLRRYIEELRANILIACQ